MSFVYLLTNICLAIAAMAGVVTAIYAIFARSVNEREARGFEVMLNTGEEPVLEKKENDHG